MPFTPTHLVAVLPFSWAIRGLPLSALIIGATAPDLPVFLPISSYHQTHTVAGILPASFPLALGVFLLFHFLLKGPLLSLCPHAVQARLVQHSKLPLSLTPHFVFMTSFALLIGIATHVGWDSFTHAGRWGVLQIPWLDQPHSIAGWEWMGYKWFQHGSSVIGLPLLGILAIWGYAMTPPHGTGTVAELSPKWRKITWVLFGALPPIVGIVAWVRHSDLDARLTFLLRQTGGALLIGLLLYAILFHISQKKSAGAS